MPNLAKNGNFFLAIFNQTVELRELLLLFIFSMLIFVYFFTQTDPTRTDPTRTDPTRTDLHPDGSHENGAKECIL